MSPSEPPVHPDAPIRPARDQDLDALVGLFGLLDEMQRPWRVFEPRADPLAEAAARFREAIDDPNAHLIVAQDGGHVVGMGMGRIAAVSSSSDEPALDVSNVIVLPSHRGRGIGSAIARDLADFARRGGARLVTLRVFSGNDEAIAFWSQLGFRPRFVQMFSDAEDL